jgi:hypothetical protein
MKLRTAWSLIGMFCLGLITMLPGQAADDPQISVYNPRGIPPAIELVPMAARLDSLEGKTIYFVDDGFLGGDILLNEMIAWFARNKPEVKTVFRKKGGRGFAAEDPVLWAEMKEKADGMVMATGH